MSCIVLAADKDVLNQNYLHKVSKAQESLDQGAVYLKESEAYLDQIKSLSSRGSRFEKDSSKLVHKYRRARLMAFTYLDDGYDDMYSAYNKALTIINLDSANTKVDDLLQAAKISHKNGRKFFKKVPEEMDKEKAVKLLDSGIEYEKAAVGRLKDAVDLFSGGAGRSDKSLALNSPVMKASAIKIDSMNVKPKMDSIVEVIIPVARIDSSSLVTNKIISMDNATTFFSIQINASKTKLSQQEISFYYRGSYLVVLMEADGYFRYSVGKFMSVADAQAVIDMEKIKGYIVGYVDNKRVSIAEVTKALTLKK